MRNRDSVLWKISSDKRHTSYLLGSMHVSFSHFPKNRNQALDLISKSDIFLAETELDVQPDLNLNVDWSNFLASNTLRKWKKIIASRHGLDIDLFLAFPPLLLYNLLIIKDLNLDVDMAMDQFLWNQAQSTGLTCEGILSASEHYRILREIDLDDQLSWLKKYLNSYSRSRRKARNLFDLYGKQKIHSIYSKTLKSLGKHRRILLTDRNEKMSSKILRKMNDHSVFAVVGAAHLSGGNGVLHLLNKNPDIRIQAI